MKVKLISDDKIQHCYNRSGLPLLFPHQKQRLIDFACEIEAIVLRRQQMMKEHEALINEDYHRQLQEQCCDPNS